MAALRVSQLRKVLAAGAASKSAAPAISAEDEAALIEPMLLNHYRAWLDIPVPALAGLTPRAAYARPDRRSQVEALLRGLATGPLAVPPKVMAMLWEELGR